MYPEKVYHCSCVDFQIKLCLINGHYSFKDIISNLNQNLNVNRKIYSSKCGKNEVIFSCREHMSLKSICEINNSKRCLKCIKSYMQTAYYCCYEYTNFDLPLVIIKKKSIVFNCSKTIIQYH